MIAIRTKLPVLLVSLLTVLGTAMWAAPAHAVPPVITVTVECTTSGADVTFANDGAVRADIYLGTSEDNIDDNVTLDPSETSTHPRSDPELYYIAYEYPEQGGYGDQVEDTLDLRDCDDGFIDVDDDLLDVTAFCDGDVTFTNISDDGLEMTYGDLPSNVDGDLVLDPDQSATVTTGRDVLEYSADSAVNDESDRGSIEIPDCDDEDDDEDDDDEDDDDEDEDDEDEDDEDAPTKAPDAGV